MSTPLDILTHFRSIIPFHPLERGASRSQYRILGGPSSKDTSPWKIKKEDVRKKKEKLDLWKYRNENFSSFIFPLIDDIYLDDLRIRN